MAKDNNINPGGGSTDDVLRDVTGSDYKYGFVSDIDSDIIARGLNEDVVRLIS